MSVERNNPTLPIRVFADAFIIVSKKTEGSNAPGYLISRLSDVLYSSFNVPRSLYVMLNLVQHLSAVKDEKRLAVRS